MTGTSGNVEPDTMDGIDPQPDGPATGVAQATTAFRVLAVVAVLNAISPWLAALEADPIDERGNSIRFIVASATIAGALLAAVARVLPRTGPRVTVGVAVVCSVVALRSIDWARLGWGTLLLVPLFLIPAVAKASAGSGKRSP
jgi:hypothetical protein